MLNLAFLFVLLRFYELYRALLLQVETGVSELTWWGVLLILGGVILIVVLALIWNASRSVVPDIEHHTSEAHEALDPPAAHTLETDTENA